MKLTKLAAFMLAIIMVLAMAGCTDRNKLPGTTSQPGSVPPSTSVPSEPNTSDNLSAVPEPSTSSTTASTTSADFSKIGTLSSKRYDWGPGGPKNEKGRPVSADTYNEKFGAYNTLFIGPDTNEVYLTFDEGYENGFTGAFLDALKERNVKGLFFLTGGYVETAPDLVKRMVDEGHVIGNHSWGHPAMPEISAEKALNDTLKLHDYMMDNYDVDMKFYRFPSGAYSEQNLELMRQLGYKTLFWSFAYKDWLVKEQPDPQTSLQKILNAAHPGAIYLFHTVSETNSKIIGDIIDGLMEKGYVIGDPNNLI